MKKISLRREEQFVHNMYPGEGIYHNTETDEILMCSDKAMFVAFIGPYDLWGHLFKNELNAEKANTAVVSESFALKAIALLSNSDKLKEYEI